MKRAIDAGKCQLDSSDEPWIHFHVGSAYSYRAMARFRRHNWIGAFLDGRRSIDHLKKALKGDPKLYDVYFGLGGYHYWRTARAGFIRAVACWMPDRRELGLRQMELAARHSRYIRNGALHGIALSLYDAGEFERAVVFNTQVVGPIEPATNGSLYMRGRLLARRQDWSNVEVTFKTLLEKLPPRSVGYQVECKYWIARASHELGREQDAREWAAEALAQSETRQPDLELENALDTFGTIYQRLVALQQVLQ